MSQNDYYGGGGGGGGFLQGGSPYSQMGSPGSGQQRSEAASSLRPINSFQYRKAEQPHNDAPWVLDGFEVGLVTMVGHLVSMHLQTTNHVYTLEDGLGRVEARHWVGSSTNAEQEMEKWGDIKEGIYVRLTGFLKSFGGKKYINATYMRPVTDFSEIDFHFLECITVTLTLERGPHYNFGTGQQQNATGVKSSSAYQLDNSMDIRDEYSHLPPLEQQIIRYLISQDQKDGVHVANIARAIGKSDEDADKLSTAMDSLMDNGHLFNTIDDCHFAVSR
ncbi:hypothetical protein AGABI1DRAFT_111214 [Agaricus bisporus var. burnettii JB137-S8]|uniref:Replication protein A C-terminal domain-containing protein n=1 Tax=Agaricus bisporus var. burnettii (strain JB137-S8 / ATCC MYA-4627 / FGSC 10392) TaxID=597362 RepID=K5XGS1_AGABU|nr:uncharacterized protein AGABI1DRAFT_111214 [Agaricus bisporus var. burnettii JB137-S8]EKM82623.1 hypothetical protein AGABI1DRAFT_111214 [Agaricus bisporus var. burnettii JB137-S8]